MTEQYPNASQDAVFPTEIPKGDATGPPPGVAATTAAYEQRLRSLRTFRGYTEDEAELAAWAADEIDRLREKLNRPGEYDLFDPKEAS